MEVTHLSTNKKRTIISLLLLIAVSLFFVAFHKNRDSYLSYPKIGASINGKFLNLYVADTELREEKGLGGVKYLPESEGMFFEFDREDFWSIWMKDMFIPIDVIWLNENNEVVYVVPNMRPEDYPHIYTPSVLTRYVIEVNAGFVEKNKIKMGQKFDVE